MKKELKEEDKEEEEDGPKKDKYDPILATKTLYDGIKIGLHYNTMNLRYNQQFLDDMHL